MNLLLDSNAILDFALHREPGFENMRKVWDAIAEGLITGYITTSSVTDIFYIASKGGKKPEDGYKVVAACLAALKVCVVTRQTLERAVMMKRKDFEDSVQIIAALDEGLDAIVTRDIKGQERWYHPLHARATGQEAENSLNHHAKDLRRGAHLTMHPSFITPHLSLITVVKTPASVRRLRPASRGRGG